MICLKLSELDPFKWLMFLWLNRHQSDRLNKLKCHLSIYWRWQKNVIFPMLIWFTIICLKVNEIDHFKGLILLWIHKPDKLNKSK
jgi:hypothetical protein